MQLATLISNFRAKCGMSAEQSPVAFLGVEIKFRSLGEAIFLSAEMVTEKLSADGDWGKLLQLNLAWQKRFKHSMAFEPKTSSLVLWRKFSARAEQEDFNREVEGFARSIKYWRKKLEKL